VIACIAPGLIGGVFLIQKISKIERERETQHVVLTARALALALDRQFLAMRAVLEVMANSPILLSGDFATFHARASQAVKKLNGSNMVVTNDSGQELVNTLAPYGEPLPLYAMAKGVDVVFRTGQPAVTSLYMGARTKRLRMAVQVPVFRDGRVQYVLAMGMDLDNLTALMEAQRLPSEWIASTLDPAGIIAARTRNADRFAGQPASGPLLEAMGHKSEGVIELTSREGIPIYSAFSRSGFSNWSVAIGVPASEFTSILYRSLLWVGTGAALLFVTGLLIAGYKARTISSGLRRLIESSAALAAGKGSSGSISNIREIDEVYQELDQAFIQRDDALRQRVVAETSARLKGEFIGTVSHELRTPLTSIAASLNLLMHMGDTHASPASSRLIAIAHSNTERLTRLVNDILDIEKLDAGKVKFRLQCVSLGKLLNTAIEEQRSLADNRGIQINCESSTAFVNADSDRLMQVFSNLLSNALKFSPPNSEVNITVEDRNGKIRISVVDHGSGIPQEFKDRIFEKFAQADTSDIRTKGGSGLGLSIVREIVRRLGGEVGFADTPGGGATFFVDLPEYQVAIPPEPAISIQPMENV
jgi:signal transduction histidine kinase